MVERVSQSLAGRTAIARLLPLSFYVSTYRERDVRQMIQVTDLSAFSQFLQLCFLGLLAWDNISRIESEMRGRGQKVAVVGEDSFKTIVACTHQM